MATAITMPKLGLTMTSGSVKEWKKKVGDTVKKGEILFVVATDKLTVDSESPADGVLLAITVKEGVDVPVGGTIGYLGAAGEAVPAEATGSPAAPESPKAASAAATPRPVGAPAPAAQAPASGPVAASPKAKRMAREKGMDLSAIQGTGPRGWVVSRDVLDAEERGTAKASPVASRMAREAGLDLASLGASGRLMKADVAASIASMGLGENDRVIPATQMRRIIGERMLESVNTVPAVNYFVDVDMSELEALRKRLNDRMKGGVRISVNDILMKLCAKLLAETPMANASVQVEEGRITGFVLHGSVNIGLAIALPGGLIVPNIKEVQNKGLKEIAETRVDLVERARCGALTPDDTMGGTFTLSNLGMSGIDNFTPIINPPEAAILGVGSTRKKPVVVEGEVVVRPIASFCLSADHRLLDGADAAALLAKLKELIENPELFLL